MAPRADTGGAGRAAQIQREHAERHETALAEKVARWTERGALVAERHRALAQSVTQSNSERVSERATKMAQKRERLLERRWEDEQYAQQLSYHAQQEDAAAARQRRSEQRRTMRRRQVHKDLSVL